MKLRYLIHIACALSLAALQSCSEKIVPEGHKGVAGPFSIEIPLLTDNGQYRTRAYDFNDSALSLSDISEIWVGLFDAVDHRLIGFGTTSSIATPTKITIENLFFDDGHPEAYAAAVANYSGVTGRLGDGPSVDLIQLLKHDIASWEDFCNIAVDVASAEAAIGNNAHVLMSGIYQRSTITRDIYVIPDDDGLLEPSDDIAFTIFTYLEFDKAFEKFIDFSSNLGIQNSTAYAIRLRPLFSHVSVNVTLNAAALNRNGGISWRLCNVPKYVYLIEHHNIADCSLYDAASWLGVTPAAGDLYGEDGYFTMEDFRSAADGVATPEGAPYDVLAGDAVSRSAGSYSFGFWHYENKHWGLPGVNSYAARERVLAGDVFAALCPSATSAFNNSASYFELRVKGTDGKDYDYRVHEGLSANIYNTASAVEYRDFSTFRNTNYTYDITISGLSSALTRGDAESAISVSVSAR